MKLSFLIKNIFSGTGAKHESQPYCRLLSAMGLLFRQFYDIESGTLNGCVAVINFSQNYSAELPEDCLIRLSPSIETDIHRLDDIVANDDLRTTLQTRSQKWLEKHNEQAEQQVREIFDLLLE